MNLMFIVPLAVLIALGFAYWLARDVLRRSTGTQAMQDVAATIYEGAVAFLRRQYTTIGIFAVVTAIILGVLIGFLGRYIEVPDVSPIQIGLMTAFAFLVGAGLSALSGIIGMWVSVKSNVRVAAAAGNGVSDALTVALRGGAVSGFTVVALSLFGVTAMYFLYGAWYGYWRPNWQEAVPFLIVGLGFGASFVALFAQLGGGIYTKAADVGADLVGKVEQGIPEDDPRNPAVVADLVGDNVGDCAGRGADLFESTVAESIGAMILGVFIAEATKNNAWIFFPLVVRSFGLIVSMAGVLVARMRNNTENPMSALNRGFYVCVVLSVLALGFTCWAMLGSQWLWFFGCGLVGLVMAIAFVYITQYYTAGEYRPVRTIASASETGPATNIIAGLSVGLESTGMPVIAISIALLSAAWLGGQAAPALGVETHVSAIYGTAVATMGMLMMAAYILAMDTFGPIADNAGGIVEMSDAPAEVREGTDALDSAGNTTKALTKGYAIGSAALAAFLLFSAYIDKVRLAQAINGVPEAQWLRSIDIGSVPVFVGGLIGACLIFVFSALAIRAVGRAAEKMIAEVRRQFRENPGIMAGTSRPDYSQAVDISTQAALREMIAPGVLAVGVPILVGVLLKYEAVAALLMVGTMAGVLLATNMNNGGGAWDNAKKYIEAGKLTGPDGKPMRKGTPAHAAAVVGDTVGDPYKDTAGPSIHVLIKLLATLTLVLAPLFL